jgi:hypothetical protein
MQKYQGNSTNAPRETFINDQRHMLAYINPFEEDLLRNYGGTGKRALVAFLRFLHDHRVTAQACLVVPRLAVGLQQHPRLRHNHRRHLMPRKVVTVQ